MEKLRTQLLAKADNFVKLANIFKEMDKDGNKNLSSEELDKGLKTLGIEMTAAEIEDIVRTLDTNDSGGVSIKEFFVGLRGILSPSKFIILMAVFKTLDKDGSGEIDFKDFKTGFDSPVVRETIEASNVDILMTYDLNEDKKVTREEFLNFHALFHGVSDDAFTDMMVSLWKLTEDEIKKAYESSLSAEKLDIIAKVFKKLDKDGSGDITPDDFKGGLHSLVQKYGSKAATLVLLEQLQSSKDAKINRGQFVKIYAGTELFSRMSDTNFVKYMKSSWEMTE